MYARLMFFCHTVFFVRVMPAYNMFLSFAGVVVLHLSVNVKFVLSEVSIFPRKWDA